MKLSRNRFPHLAAGAAALPFASRVAGKLYAEVMETQLWQSNVGIAEFGQHNLHHLGSVCANNSDSDVLAKKSADQRMRHKCVRSAVMETQLWRSECRNRRTRTEQPSSPRFRVCANNSDSDVLAKKSADQRMRHKCIRSAELGAGQVYRCPMSSASPKCYNRRRCAQNPLQVRFA
jgi:hypothetical protein